jgi:hypothetical protein
VFVRRFAVAATRSLAVIVPFAMVFLAAGCGGPRTVSLTKDDLAWLAAQSRVEVVTHPPAPLMLSGGAGHNVLMAFGAIGGAAAYSRAKSQGETLAREFALADPTIRIRDTVIERGGPALGLQNVALFRGEIGNDELSTLRKATSAATVLDFRMVEWALRDFPTRGNRFWLSLATRARLIRLADEKVVWETTCRTVRPDVSTGASLDELKADGGALLKTRTDEAAAACADQLVTSLVEKPA